MNFWIENGPSPPWNFSKNSSILGFSSLTRPLFGFQKRMEDKGGAKWFIKYLLVSKYTKPPTPLISFEFFIFLWPISINPSNVQCWDRPWSHKTRDLLKGKNYTRVCSLRCHHLLTQLSSFVKSANSASGLCNYVRALNILDKISMQVDTTTFGEKTRISSMVLSFVSTDKVPMIWNKEGVFLGM